MISDDRDSARDDETQASTMLFFISFIMCMYSGAVLIFCIDGCHVYFLTRGVESVAHGDGTCAHHFSVLLQTKKTPCITRNISYWHSFFIQCNGKLQVREQHCEHAHVNE
jgi:hypothetical protein